MNRRKNLLCVFFLVLTMLFCALGVDAFAANAGQPAAQTTTGENGSGQQTGAQSQASDAGAGGSQAEIVSSKPEPGDQPVQGGVSSSSSPAASSSRPAASSRAASKAVRRRASSAPVSSAVVSEASSDVFSGESSAAESVISLPGVGSVAENDPLSSAITNPEQARRMNVQGLLAWACIGLGVLVVLVVVLSNRRPPRGPGRKRYRRQKRGSGKHLLNDRYYRDLNRY